MRTVNAVQAETKPWLSGAFPEPGVSFNGPTVGEPLWPDMPCLRRAGDWGPGELRTAAHELGRVVIFGNCVSSEEAIATTLRDALTEEDPAKLSTLTGSYTSLLFRQNRLTVLADLTGQFPLYYRADHGNTFRFSTTTDMLRDPNHPIDVLTWQHILQPLFSMNFLRAVRHSRVYNKFEADMPLMCDRTVSYQANRMRRLPTLAPPNKRPRSIFAPPSKKGFGRGRSSAV